MKRVSQASQKKNYKKSILFFFKNIEQVFGFLFFITAISVTFWAINNFKNWMDDPDREVLSQIILKGELEFTTESDIRTAIVELGLLDTYVGQDVEDIQREILRLPWIKEASVRKQWPDKLIIYITEFTPMFYWNDLFLLDGDGVVFTVPFDRTVKLVLPRLYGPENKEKNIVQTYSRLMHLYEQYANKQFTLTINSALVDERNAWQLVINSCVTGFCNKDWKMKLLLGSENIEKRYQQFLRLFPEIRRRTSKNEQILVADLRYENGISVQKK